MDAFFVFGPCATLPVALACLHAIELPVTTAADVGQVHRIHTYVSICIPIAQPPKPASLRGAGFAAFCGDAGMRLLLARVWLCEDP